MTKPHTVLVVDDEEFVRTILTRILKRDKFIVHEAKDGKEAMAQIAANPPDFVISDIRMPEMDGMELLVHIKKDHPGVGVAIITGHPGAYSPEELIANGADHYIIKPFKADQISRAMREMIALHNK